MIVVKISMGLGNQMFQYAAAKALSLEKSTTLKLDTSTYGGYKLRKYELAECFNINAPLAIPEEIARLNYRHPVKAVWSKLFPSRKMRTLALPYEEPAFRRNLLQLHDFFLPPHKRKTYIEPHYCYDHNFYKASDDVYLQGYWMSWRYFEKYETAIKKEFIVNRSLVAHLDNLVADMQKQNSTSIHIRRTDYTTQEVIALKGQTTIDFYKQAMAYIESDITDPVYYMFSDDITWVKENFPLQDRKVIYVDNTITNSAIEDFYLMTQCKHNIITNSTFG
ncbi:MAG: alpha-1,2-fucosyltransferase, partial [Panacibacter sp.]